MKTNCEEEVNKKLEEALPTAIQKGLRDMSSEMVCAYKFQWKKSAPGTVVTYDRITSELNNTDRPGGVDGGMDIATGVFTATTSGHYIITFSLGAFVKEGEYTWLFLHHNGAAVEESEWASAGGNFFPKNAGYVNGVAFKDKIPKPKRKISLFYKLPIAGIL